VTVEGEALDDLGMLLDFGVLKKIVEGGVIGYWDHRTILAVEDGLRLAEDEVDRIGENPTAEVMARAIWIELKTHPELNQEESKLRVSNVRLYETPDCWVDYNE
jgi:6-pyruvoyltetrahydropterin/6-carboxytetrahydropterin synthase